MKDKIDIELWEDKNVEDLKQFGITDKLLENIFRMAFEQLLNDITKDGGGYSLNVEIVEGVE